MAHAKSGLDEGRSEIRRLEAEVKDLEEKLSIAAERERLVGEQVKFLYFLCTSCSKLIFTYRSLKSCNLFFYVFLNRRCLPPTPARSNLSTRATPRT